MGMGLDLRLLPFEGSEVVPYSHSILSLERDRVLFKQLRLAPVRSVPVGFMSYLSSRADGERCYGVTVETPYGEPLMWATAWALLNEAAVLLESPYSRNRAVLAYLKELPPETQVALYWH